MIKLFHLSDLHIGTIVNGFSMLEDQEDILKKILKIIDEEKPDGILLAGDIYDVKQPSDAATRLLDYFLTRLAVRNLPVYMISGNHDSAAKISFASELIENSGVYIAPVYDGNAKNYLIEKEGIKVRIHLLPFIKPAVIRPLFPEIEINDYTDALKAAVSNMQLDPQEKQVLVAHQFVTGASRSDSEQVSVGGLDNVDVSVFDAFDYVALGHIHGPQSIGRETVRYSGTPLKYSFSEADHKKSVTIVEIDDTVRVRTRELVPAHDMRIIKGTYEELTLKKNYEGTNLNDYIQAILTDEEDIPDAMSKLRTIYPNIMTLIYKNTRTMRDQVMEGAENVEKKHPIDLFDELYQIQNNQNLSDEQKNYLKPFIERIWEGEE